jgi:hypothetical protein
LAAASSSEILLAEEQGVLRRAAGAEKRIEATFGGGGEEEGTLLLTNKRLVFASGGAREEGAGQYRVEAVDVSQLGALASNPSSASIPLEAISSVEGHRGELGLPSLDVKWKDPSGEAKSLVFHQKLVERTRKKNLNDWARVIQRLKSGQQKVATLPAAPSTGTMEGKVLAVLGDMQEKGALQIETEVERQFEIDTDPDEVEAACEKLAGMGLVDLVKDPAENFYRKRSPLGEDDLSS